MFHPGAIVLKTISGVRAVAVAVWMGTKASFDTLTETLSFPHLTVTVPLPAVVVRLAPAERVRAVSCFSLIWPVSTPHQDASQLTVGCSDEVTVRVTAPPKRSKETLVLSTVSLTCGMPCVTGIIRLCLSPITRMELERLVVPVFSWAETVSLRELEA